MELAKRVLRYRISNNLTQKEMANELDISHVTLIDIERDEKVSRKTMIKVELKLDELEGRN